MVGDVRFSSETFPWVVDADFSKAPHACCRVLMVEHSENKLHAPSWANADASRRVLCTSNWFFVVQTLTLRHLERAYAAFCRMNNIHMEGISASVLEAQGVQVRQVHVRGCLGLRRPYSFELAPENLIKCSEGLLLTSISHTIVGQSDERYRLRSHRVFLLEGLHLREGKGHWCENQMISEGFDGSVRLQEMIGSPFLAPMIDFTFHVLMTAYQILCFFAFSAMGAAFLELLQTYHAESASHDVLQVSKLEADAKSLGHLPMSAVDFFTFHVLVSLLCILIANVMQDTPGIIPHLADHVLQLVSTCTVGVSIFCLCVMLLFFLIGALLNPSSALKPLLIVGSCGAVVATMWMQFSNLTRGLLKVRPDFLLKHSGMDGFFWLNIWTTYRICSLSCWVLKILKRQLLCHFWCEWGDGEGLVQMSCFGVYDNVLHLNHVQFNSLTHEAVFGGRHHFEGDWIPSWYRLRRDPWKHGRASEVRSGRCHLWWNGFGLCMHESRQSFSRWDRRALDFSQWPTKYIQNTQTTQPKHQTRWINQDGPIFFPYTVFSPVLSPTNFGTFFHGNLSATSQPATLQLHDLVRFGCRRPTDETIQRSIVQLCETRPRDN